MGRYMHLGPAHCSSFSSEDHNLLCTVGADGDLRLIDLRERTLSGYLGLPSVVANHVSLQTSLCIPAAHGGHPVYAVELTDRFTAFSGGADHKLKRWDLRVLSQRAPACLGEY